MKICQINCVYATGSTGKIVKILHNQSLMCGDESLVIHSIKNKRAKDNNVYGISCRILSKITAACRMALGDPFGGARIQTTKLLSILKHEAPDVVHLHCINGNNINVYRLMKYLALNNIRTILTLHAEFPYTGGCAHAFDCEKWKTGCEKCLRFKEETRSLFFDRTEYIWKKQKKCFDLFDPQNITIVAVSPWLKVRAMQSPMLNRFNICTVFNGTDTKTFFKKDDIDHIRIKYKLPLDEKIILHVTAYFDSLDYEAKGGRYIIDLAERLKNEKVKIVVAATRTNVKELPDNVILIGRTETQDELASLYSLSNLTVITSMRETFSMPVSESLCCGTPVVGFLAGGPESIAIDRVTEFVEYGDTDSLYKAVKKFLDIEFDRESICREAKSVYSENEMYMGYKNIYLKLINGD